MVGGGEIDDWKQQIAGLEVERERRRERGTEFAAQLATVELGTPVSEDVFLSLQRDVTARREALEAQEKDSDTARWDAEAAVRDLATQLENTRQELKSLTSRASNLHSEDVALRDAIAAAYARPRDRCRRWNDSPKPGAGRVFVCPRAACRAPPPGARTVRDDRPGRVRGTPSARFACPGRNPDRVGRHHDRAT